MGKFARGAVSASNYSTYEIRRSLSSIERLHFLVLFPPFRCVLFCQISFEY